MKSVQREENLCRAMMSAMINWFVDMDMPRKIHIAVDATLFDVGVMHPEVNGLYQIRLNISANAIKDFRFTDQGFSFYCGYNKQNVFLEVPYAAVLGFIVPTGEATESFMPIPNMHREMLVIERSKDFQEKLQGLVSKHDGTLTMNDLNELMNTESLPDGAYAVHGVDTPTVSELMTRAPVQERKVPDAPAVAKPLLDFGDVGTSFFPKHVAKRRANGPHLTLIQGGKA